MWFIWQVSNTTLLTAFINSQTKLKIRFPKLLLVARRTNIIVG